jgi:tetratricopeptide (TPR) repeat protein
MVYNMKKVMITMALVAFGINAFAQQTLEGGIKMYNYKRFKTAEGILAPLADKDPVANYYLGLSYLYAGDVAKATGLFTKFPEDIANISGTARVAFISKDPVKGMKIAKDLAAKAKKKDWMPQKYAADAITYTEGGDYSQAAAWYKDALTKNDNPETHIGLGDAMRKIQGGGGEAMTNYEIVTDKDKNNSLAYTRIGDLWYDARNYQSALDNYAKAKDADNSNPLPYQSLANAYSRSGRYKLALQNLQTYLEHSDNTDEDQMEYARALYQAQSYCDAATTAAKLLTTQQDKAKKIELYGILGFSQADCGDSVQALKSLRTYFQMQEPKKILPGAYIQLGKLFMKLDMLDSAGFYYTKGIAGDTSRNKTDVYRDIAEGYKTKKDYCKSAEWYANLVKSNPETQAADYVWRVIMYYYCKDLNNALTAANEFTNKYDATQPSASYWQARVSAAIDSEATTGAAVPYFQKWLDKVGPNYEKKNDLKGAYEYMLYYYFNKKDKENLKVYRDKLLAIDPENKSVKEIDALEKSGSSSGKKPGAGKK